jgi:hypothetical protein
MALASSTTSSLQGGWKRNLAGVLTAGVAVAMFALIVTNLGGELWAAWAEDGEPAAATTGPRLPVDGPAVSLARVNHLQEANTKAIQTTAAPDAPEILDEAVFTQFTGGESPFFFNLAPNGFDFFNPLFAFNFGSPPPVLIQNNFFFFGTTPSTTNNTFTLPGGTMVVTSPFGFPVTSTTVLPGVTINFAQTGGFFGGFPTSTTTTISFPFVTSTSLVATVQITTTLNVGVQPSFHRHGFLFTTQTITVLSPIK